MKAIARVAALVLLGLLILLTGGWSILALYYAGPASEGLRYVLITAAAVVLLAALCALCVQRWRWRGGAAYLALFTAVLLWFFSIAPSNTRDWQTDVAALPSATIDGDVVTVHNIRNFAYRSETDYTPAYYDKRFDLRQLEGVDVVAVYWMGPAVAHVFLSFAFAGDEHLAISIETRKEKGEDYSTIAGFFRRYELYYVVADERDVIRLRTNYRHNPIEDVYVYRAAGTLEQARRLFLEYIKQINALNAHPEFYNTLTTNCTTTIWLNTRVNAQHVPFNWKILVSGYLPQFLYEQGRLIADGQPFSELQQRVHINARAHAADTAPDFSRRIRDSNAVQAEPAPNVSPMETK